MGVGPHVSENGQGVVKPIRVIRTHVKHEMNGLERKYAEVLDLRKRVGDVIDWRFEAMKLKLGRDWTTTYTPDFAVVLEDGTLELHECKGFMRAHAAVKIKVAAKDYPWFVFRLVKWVNKEWVITEV